MRNNRQEQSERSKPGYQQVSDAPTVQERSSGAFIALGEKRPSVAVPVALAVASAFQLLLSRGLGLWIDDPILRLLGLQ